MADRNKQTIETLTGRRVLAFLSQAHVEPDITIEIFFVDGPLDGFSAPSRSPSRSSVPAVLSGRGGLQGGVLASIAAPPGR
jgi:hypothetical protein